MGLREGQTPPWPPLRKPASAILTGLAAWQYSPYGPLITGPTIRISSPMRLDTPWAWTCMMTSSTPPTPGTGSSCGPAWAGGQQSGHQRLGRGLGTRITLAWKKWILLLLPMLLLLQLLLILLLLQVQLQHPKLQLYSLQQSYFHND